VPDKISLSNLTLLPDFSTCFLGGQRTFPGSVSSDNGKGLKLF
jgi:hypothetical protein